MRRRGMLVALALGCGLLVTAGCKATVPKTRYDAAMARVNELALENQQLQKDLDEQRAKAAQVPDISQWQSELGPDAKVVMRGGSPAVVVESGLLYSSGKATLTSQGKSVLSRVARSLKSRFPDAIIRVEGHTDTDPIRVTKKLYKNNWELGAKRATEVVEYLVTHEGIDPKRIYAASFSMYHPISTNKARNRRVEIVVLPGAASPAPMPSAPTTSGPATGGPATTSSFGEEEPK